MRLFREEAACQDFQVLLGTLGTLRLNYSPISLNSSEAQEDPQDGLELCLASADDFYQNVVNPSACLPFFST